MQPLTRSRPRSRFFGASGPSFALDFVNGTNALDPRVTFTRASSATFFNSAGVLTSAAINTPRFDYNPSTLAARGLLIEEARTNSIRNNTMQGAAAGTPGTLPTNWAYDPSSTGLSRQVVATGTDNGINYVDLRVFGTAAAANYVAFYFESGTSVAAVSGQTWTGTYYLKLTAGSTAGLTALPSFGINENTSGGVFVAGGNGGATTPTATWQRVTYTRTLSGGGTVATVLPYVLITVSNGVAIDITLRIGLPQLEQGAFATSVIPTTTTALTRAADVASVNTLSPWYNAAEGTLFAEYSLPVINSATAQNAIFISDNTSSNRNTIRTSGPSSNNAGVVFSGGVIQSGLTSAIAVVNVTQKIASAYKVNDFAYSDKGGAVQTDTSGTIPTVTQMQLGNGLLADYLNGYLRRITYYPTRLSNAQLQAITA